MNDPVVLSELRRRLAEAEETLNAIREGEVDALVIGEGGVDEVFAIGGDTESYRTFMEAMDTGAAAVDEDGRVLYANSALCRLIDHPLPTLQGKPLVSFFDARAAAEIGQMVGKTANQREKVEISLKDAATKMAQVFLVSAKPVRLGLVQGHAVTFTDLTERVRSETAERAERIAAAIIASANEIVVVCDRVGMITHANSAASAIYDGDLIGKMFEDAIPLTFTDAPDLMSGGALIDLALNGQARQGIEAIATRAPKVKDYLISAAPLQVTEDQISGCVLTMVDLSQRKAAEHQQLLLMRELDHRVRNTLALVLSISNRTLSNEDTLQGFHQAFTQRIHGLAATHSLLAKQGWTKLSLHDIVRAELAPYVETDGTRLRLEGGEVALIPRAAIALGLIFHELATNAVKYGALSREGGHVLVAVRGPTADGAAMRVDWVESGGPMVSPPQRKGFGHTVISHSLAYSSKGGTDLSFPPEGVICALRIPMEDIP
ncbi:sensor histidine kinase [Rhodospirillum rubrum]|uniref:histidine kinase n=1 Tax=Rhodospirillum rubrum (strain ATCC 11170 / ATH 1.1.1 / DSM 467 / LMG 4362 / NCIMB 8255 / S1) TaxID=269796 RepID=Q2RRA1_RHORT|nr:PAS domain-containing sensor histidine kinase [Rhodospirillum rubrum]ABC23344.1 signal transduction histidine kinase [Rhodospirillum rubrum ATCC 11170]AEO49077.1 signal transduction histidine kinase [Rhodospirillum rubrum F11]MBK5954988.1 histidine kinase [Rhodospirillum rubrum]QXG79317.1 PAS domain-containing protein [Rhodospirillum rubrum]HCF16671.1 PAS domain S-box protein [Rhodospirillum rubrum]